ncbi:N-acetyltransferase [Geothrix limicola]|uniref:N-acetyltransferase n=1 Tax=Geothrix limicola TaxID=2927978 RepID=A0ABQ5QJS2_9BACT|nr:GNAT family N-acetyltransferase [Geothrix limicola]GLH74576.1 N-acetyltransferase [Geothrix limicola]
MDLRIATVEDSDHLAGLAVSFRNHLERTAPSDAQFQASIEYLLSAEDAAFYLAFEEGAAIGYVLQRYRFSMWAAGLEATIEDLFVSPDHRQGGVGRRLIAFALEQARAKGCATVCLDTNEHNAASTRIYTQLGFNAVSKRWNGRQIFFRLNL